jgi:hypothetical protein
MQLLEDALQLCPILTIVIKFPQLGVGLKPQAIVLGFLQCFEGCFIKVLQQLHLGGGKKRGQVGLRVKGGHLFGSGDVVENGVDGLFRVVSCHGAFDVLKELFVA